MWELESHMVVMTYHLDSSIGMITWVTHHMGHPSQQNTHTILPLAMLLGTCAPEKEGKRERNKGERKREGKKGEKKRKGERKFNREREKERWAQEKEGKKEKERKKENGVELDT